MVRYSLFAIAVVFSVFLGTGHAAPQAPQDAQAPFVQSVSFYKDWQLTQPITTAVEPGTTIYTKIVFSEPMQLKVADDDTARPVLYYGLSEGAHRYRIAGHGAAGADFVSGDAKPLQGGTDDYICKYTVPEDGIGVFVAIVGNLSADLSGNTIENFYVHPEQLTIGSEDVALASIGGGTPNFSQPTGPSLDAETLIELVDAPLDTEALIELVDTTDLITVVDTAPGEKPRDAAFIFRKFLEQLLADWKKALPGFDYDVETIFKTPGTGFMGPWLWRPPDWHLHGIYIPDVIKAGTLDQLNEFSAAYQLTKDELFTLLENLKFAHVYILPIGEYVSVWIPDLNLRKAVIAHINERGISLGPINRPKEPHDTIYQGEMWRIEDFTAEAAGIESLIGLEHAINLRALHLGNEYGHDWDIIWIEEEGKTTYKVTKPETPNKISNLEPLKGLHHLEVLDLTCNAVSNLEPLRTLTNLTDLRLSENKVHFIFALENLTNLEYLYLGNYYYSPKWAGNNDIRSLSPLRNLINLRRLDVAQNRISSLGVVRNFPKLQYLQIGCCGISDLRPLVDCPGLRGPGRSWVYLAYNPISEIDAVAGAIPILRARGVYIATSWWYEADGSFNNGTERCSVGHRESFRAAPALQRPTELDVLSSVWHDLSQVPEETALMPNYPNPFNPETWIPYQLATPAEVRVAIHAADGRFVRALALGYQTAGVYHSKGRAVYWDGRNAQGEIVASGVYFYTLTAGNFTATRKMLIRK